MRAKRNGLIQTFRSLSGNPKACLYTEPLWGIPYNLFLPFASVYMAALGLSSIMIGLVSTVCLASQMAWALVSGVITDKLGRRLTTLIFDILSWGVPVILWMFARDDRWFLVAAVFNGSCRVPEISWNLLMIEDAKRKQLVHVYSMMYIGGLVAGFFAPLAYIFVQKYSVVPTLRVLYGIAFVMMMAKFIVLYLITKETSVGVRRMRETRGEGLVRRLWGSRFVLKRMLSDRRTMLTVGLIACFAGLKNINDTFWPLLVTKKLAIATENLSLFSTVKTLLMLGCYFWIVPRLDLRRFRNPVLLGLTLFLVQEVLMLVIPAGAYPLVLLSVVMEALALSLLNPLTTSLQMINIDREERARMLGFFLALCMLVTSPLSTVAGILAEIDRALPFVLSLLVTAAALVFTALLWKLGFPQEEADEGTATQAEAER